MDRSLTSDEFAAALRSFRYTAFRLEIQPTYLIPEEQALLARFRAGEQVSPTEVPGLRQWFEQVAEQTRQGKRIERVRITDDPPTDYQRLARWCDRWNIEAGEVIRYLSRQQAHELGLLPTAGPHDWWLFDSHQLMTIIFDDDGRLTEANMTDDPARVVQAAMWRDLAIHHSLRGTARSDAA